MDGVLVPSAPSPGVAAIRASITAGVVVEDRAGNITMANPAAERLLGPYLTPATGWGAPPDSLE